MADVLPLRSRPVTTPAVVDPVAALPDWAREEVGRRLALLQRAERGLDAGVSAATLSRWRKAYREGGAVALAPAYKGRQRKPQPWDARALEYIQLPSRMNSGAIAYNLRQDGFADVTPAQVRRFRKTLPSHLDETSKQKLGKHYHRQNETPYVIRDWGHVPVGYLYEMDGHTCDFYCEHPTTGKHFRPELTLLWDVRSQYIVDFWLGGFENSMDLRWLLSRAFLAHDHVCHELHIDPGAGKARTMTDPVTGFGAKLAFAVHFALPGNARGKGLTEGGFNIFEQRFGKTMPTYLHNRTDDAMRLFTDKWNKGRVPHMTIRQLHDLILERFITPTRNEPRKGLDGKSPAELWATLQKNPVIAGAAALYRPRESRTVQNGRVTLHKRRYELPQPQRGQWEDRQVVVEYDEQHDDFVWIYDEKGRFQCEAPLVHRRPGLPASRVQERLLATEAGQRKRLELKMAENAARARLPMTSAGMLDAIDDIGTRTPDAIDTDPAPVLASRSTFTSPEPVQPRKSRDVNPAALNHLKAEVAADEAATEAETETPDERLARALDLEARQRAGDTLAADDARWLAIYTASPEYHSRKALIDEILEDY
ncbi:MAG TPA: Mu transposase C-terminal domain-containing protein [Oleiagrimonas sp.]|nr:Mu transposase C-terminal domain-containing protein [Oleiagrimonas sp.]